MPRKTLPQVNFSEIFEHAEKNFGISWNECNDLFFHTILNYKGHNEMYRTEALHEAKAYKEMNHEWMKNPSPESLKHL